MNVQYFNDSTCGGSPENVYYIVGYCFANYFKYDCTDGQAIERLYDEHTPNCAGNPTNTTTFSGCGGNNGPDSYSGIRAVCSSSTDSTSAAVTVGGVIGAILFVIIICCIIFACRRRRRARYFKQYQQGLLTPAAVQPAQPKVIVTNANSPIQPQATYVVTQPQQIDASGNIYMAPQQLQPQVIYHAPAQPNMIVNNATPSQPVQQMVPIQQKQPQVPVQQIQSQPVYQQSQNNNIMASAPPQSLPNASNGVLGNANDDAPPPYSNLDDEGSNFEANSTQSYQ